MKEWFYHLALALACQKKGDLFRQLCARFGSAKGAIAATQEDLARITGLLQAAKIKDPALLAQAAQESELIEQLGAFVLPLGDPSYPTPLAAILDPPPVLFAKGRLPLAKRPIIAIVGSRKSDEYGLQQADKLARQLARRGAIVVSGGAVGIDTAAHKGALAEGGHTIAVLGTGLAETYPKENASLFEEIGRGRGLLLSELTAKTSARPENFPRRNRLISGITEAVIVIRGDLKSGASHTAKAAREQGRRIYAVPGRADEPLSQLPHRLLREGALLCESADDVLFSDTSPQLALFEETPLLKFTGDARRVYDALSSESESIDVLVNKTSLSSSKVSAALLELELAGACTVYPGGRYARKTQ
jgi:DNA processing protein